MRKDLNAQEKADILDAQRIHLQQVMDFRQIQSRLNSMSEQSTCCGSVPSGGGLLKVDMDYCDQSKFRVPRNVSSSKNLDACWRPQISLGGVLIWGVLSLAFGCLSRVFVI